MSPILGQSERGNFVSSCLFTIVNKLLSQQLINRIKKFLFTDLDILIQRSYTKNFSSLSQSIAEKFQFCCFASNAPLYANLNFADQKSNYLLIYWCYNCKRCIKMFTRMNTNPGNDKLKTPRQNLQIQGRTDCYINWAYIRYNLVVLSTINQIAWLSSFFYVKEFDTFITNKTPKDEMFCFSQEFTWKLFP